MQVKTIGFSALLGATIFLEKIIFPPPYDKLFTVFIQAALLTIGFLIAGPIGPMLAGVISGALMTIVRPEFFAMTFFFAALYGLLISMFMAAFGVNQQRRVSKKRLLVSSALASAIVGSLSSLTSIYLGVIVFNISIVVGIMVAGIVEGALGGYLASIVWEKSLRYLVSN